MPAVKVYQTPWESAQALIKEHVLAKYGIANADPLTLIADIAYGPMPYTTDEDGEIVWMGTTPELRFAAAKELLRYTRPQVRAVHVQLDGQIDVQHSDKAEVAKKKVAGLLAALSAKKYAAGQVADGELIEAAPEPAAEPVPVAGPTRDDPPGS